MFYFILLYFNKDPLTRETRTGIQGKNLSRACGGTLPTGSLLANFLTQSRTTLPGWYHHSGLRPLPSISNHDTTPEYPTPPPSEDLQVSQIPVPIPAGLFGSIQTFVITGLQ